VEFSTPTKEDLFTSIPHYMNEDNVPVLMGKKTSNPLTIIPFFFDFFFFFQLS